MSLSIHPRLVEHEHIVVKHCRNGVFAYNVNDLYISRSLDVFGEWAEAEVSLLCQLLEPGDVVVDAGANLGTHTVPFAGKVTASGWVVALEPQRLTFQLLCANVALNGLVNVECLKMAASDERGAVRIPVLDPSQKENFGSMAAEGNAEGEPVATMCLDDLELPRCKLIKIDVEGMEAKVLAGARRTITAHQPVLFVENNTEDHSPVLLRALDDLGYTCWWHIAHLFNPDNYFENSQNIFEGVVPESNLLCFPKGVRFDTNQLWSVDGLDDTWLKATARHGHRMRLIPPKPI